MEARPGKTYARLKTPFITVLFFLLLVQVSAACAQLPGVMVRKAQVKSFPLAAEALVKG